MLSFIKKNKIGLFIAILSFFAAYSLNSFNISQLPAEQKRKNQTVKTSDDPSYLNAPKNFIDKGVWKDNNRGLQSHFNRSPGYGLFFMPFYYFFKTNDLAYFKIFQVLLFSVAIFVFYKLCLLLTNNLLLSVILTCFLGITPFSSSFLFYTLTEGITPAFIIFFTYSLFKAKHSSFNKLNWYILSALLFAVVFIIRPVLGILIFGLLFFIIGDYYKLGIKIVSKTLILIILISFSTMSVWQIRNYKLTGDYIGLHPVYYKDNNSIFRPTLNSFWNFVEGWAEKGSDFHSYTVPFWTQTIQGDTSENQVKKLINNFPSYVINYYGKERLFNVFRCYQLSIFYQKEYYNNNLSIDDNLIQKETIAISQIDKLTQDYKNNFWFNYHVISPIKVFKELAFHSNLSLYIFQTKYRGNIMIELLRIICYSFHVLLFINVFIVLINTKNKSEWFYFGVVPFIYIFYLCYFQRGIEERYTLPFVPILVLGLALNVNHFFKSKKA